MFRALLCPSSGAFVGLSDFRPHEHIYDSWRVKKPTRCHFLILHPVARVYRRDKICSLSSATLYNNFKSYLLLFIYLTTCFDPTRGHLQVNYYLRLFTIAIVNSLK